jgi:hypothetical protein
MEISFCFFNEIVDYVLEVMVDCCICKYANVLMPNNSFIYDLEYCNIYGDGELGKKCLSLFLYKFYSKYFPIRYAYI